MLTGEARAVLATAIARKIDSGPGARDLASLSAVLLRLLDALAAEGSQGHEQAEALLAALCAPLGEGDCQT